MALKDLKVKVSEVNADNGINITLNVSGFGPEFEKSLVQLSSALEADLSDGSVDMDEAMMLAYMVYRLVKNYRVRVQ